MEYCYWCLHRPPMLGAIPRDVAKIENVERFVEDMGGHTVYLYAKVWYDRPLTDDELYQYELVEGEHFD